MPRPRLAVCRTPGCPALVVAGGRDTLCPACQAGATAARGTTTQRGYGADHQALRRRLAPAVERGEVDCWRCGERIEPGEAWDLGHDDADRSRYRGPEHRGRCNRAAAARVGNAGR